MPLGNYLMLTNIRIKEPPSLEDFEQAKIQDFEWEWVWDQAERYAAIKKGDKYYTGRIQQHSLNYNTKQEREIFMEALNEYFQIVGTFSKFTQFLASTNWIDNVNEVPHTFDFYYNDKDVKSSKLTLKELMKLLAQSRSLWRT